MLANARSARTAGAAGGHDTGGCVYLLPTRAGDSAADATAHAILGVKLRHWLRLVRTLERVRRSCWRAEILSDAEILDTCAEIEEYKIASDLVHPRHRTSPYCPVTKRHWIGVEWPVILREIRTLGRVSETVTEAGHVLRKRARAQCEHIPDLEEQDRAVRTVMDAMGL